MTETNDPKPVETNDLPKPVDTVTTPPAKRLGPVDYLTLYNDELERLTKTSVDHLTLWNEVTTFLQLNFELSDEQEYDVITGWIFATYIPERWFWYPILHFLGAHKSGKTRAQDTVSQLCMNRIMTVGMTLSALKHSIKGKADGFHVLFFDEFYLNLKNESSGDKLSILNAGYRQGGCVQDCVQNSEGEWEPKSYPCEGFKSIAGRLSLEASLRSRSITVRMRKTRKEFPMLIDLKQSLLLKARLKAWNNQNREKPDFCQITPEIETLLFEQTGKDGRLRELYCGVYVVAPKEVQPEILKYLTKIGQREAEEEVSSFDSEIFSAILKAASDKFWFSTKSVTEQFNNGKPENEKIKSYIIGRKIKAPLGFEPKHREEGNGFVYDQKLVDKLKERYEIEGEDGEQTTLDGSNQKRVYDLFALGLELGLEQVQQQLPDVKPDEIQKLLEQLTKDGKLALTPDGYKYRKA